MFIMENREREISTGTERVRQKAQRGYLNE